MTQKVEFTALVLRKNTSNQNPPGVFTIEKLEFYNVEGKIRYDLDISSSQQSISKTNATNFFVNTRNIRPFTDSSQIFSPAFEAEKNINGQQPNTVISKLKLLFFDNQIRNDQVSIDSTMSFNQTFYLIHSNSVFQIPSNFNYRLLFNVARLIDPGNGVYEQKLYFGIGTKEDFLFKTEFLHFLLERVFFNIIGNSFNDSIIRDYLDEFFTVVQVNASNLTTQIP